MTENSKDARNEEKNAAANGQDAAVTAGEISPSENAENPAPKKRRTRKKPDLPQVYEPRKISDNITFCADGKYRWDYDFNLLTNPAIFWLIWKIFFFIILGIFTISFLATVGQPGFFWEGFVDLLKGYGIALAVATGLCILGYLLYAAIMGGKYSVGFEMDEKGILHKQKPQQAKKARKLAAMTTFAGIASRRPTTVGIGLTSAAKVSSYSDFSKVRKVKANRLTRVIKVNELFGHNQVYAAKCDFDFVLDFILAHCTNTKKQKRLRKKNGDRDAAAK